MGSSGKFMEHRWGTRFQMDVPAEITTPAGFAASGYVRNASVIGAFVETRMKFPLFSRVAVHALPREGEWLDAWVVRVEGSGIAIEWLDPGLRAVSGLLSLRIGGDMPDSGTARAGMTNA